MSSCLREPRTGIQAHTASVLTHECGVAGSHIHTKCWDMLIDSSQKQSNFCKQRYENKLSLQSLNVYSVDDFSG